jgi:hypothetical protein
MLRLFLSKTWIYSEALAVIIVSSFIVFRFVGAMMVGEITSVQGNFITFELIEVAIGLVLIIKFKRLKGN